MPVVYPIYAPQWDDRGIGLTDPGLDIETVYFRISDNIKPQNGW
jgi:hypothetical protein